MEKKKLKAELWDKMHYLFRDYNDRMVHLELEYDYKIDIDALKTVIICFFEKIPVLHSSFTDNHISPYWTVNKYTIDEILTVKDVDESDIAQEVDSFLTQYIPPEANVQMKVGVFYHGDKSTLCIVENHMCMDGGDFKFFCKSLCENYNKYIDERVTPIDVRSGSRSYQTVYNDFKPSDKKAAENLYKNINKSDNHRFPFAEATPEDKSFIARRVIPAEKFLKIKTEGKKYGATINDMIMAAYFYSIYELAGYDESESMCISGAIDLRRHKKNIEDSGYTNHTAWMQCKIPERGRDIFATLQYSIRSANQFKQDKFMGLHGLPLLSLGYKIMPHAASEEIIKIGYSNPYFAMSNIGILETDKLALQGHEPVNGFMSGAVKYKPFILLSATTMRNVLTLSVCCRGNEEDKQIINKFFDLIVKNLDILIEGNQ